MIIIGRNIIRDWPFPGHIRLGETERHIFNAMLSVDTVFSYPSDDILQFELVLRKELVNVSERLHNSFFSFRLFKDAMCNTRYWDITSEGGFRLKKM